MLFQLTDNPPVRGLIVIVLVVAVAAEAAILGTAFNVGDDWEGALWVAAFVLALAIAFAISAWLMNQGEVRVTDERLEIRAKASKQLIAWTDIAAARVRAMAELGQVDRFLAAIADRAEKRQLVEVDLKRSLRLAALPWQPDTPDAIGLPAVPSRRIRVYVSDPEGLVRAIDTHLGRGTH